MVYLVLDLSELLPHSSRYQKLPNKLQAEQGTVNNPSDGVRPVKSANNRSPIGPIEHRENPSIPRPTPIPGPPPSFETDPKPAPNPTPLPIPAVKPKGPLIEDVDQNVDGEVALPPVIDINPTRSSLPTKDNLPTKPAEVLTRFLAAKTLAERRPYMTASLRSEAELVRSALNKPLPPVIRQRIVHHIKDNSDKHSERFFEVSFDRDPEVTPVPILVQLNEWGDGRIKVHADAFLDLFNDEMAQFGAVPVKGERTFHAIADAYKRCFDDVIPDAANKSFIKLRQHEQITPRLKAYFPTNSAITQKIAQPTGLPWGRSGICTVTVRWNIATKGRPFVELVRIDGFTWHP